MLTRDVSVAALERVEEVHELLRRNLEDLREIGLLEQAPREARQQCAVVLAEVVEDGKCPIGELIEAFVAAG